MNYPATQLQRRAMTSKTSTLQTPYFDSLFDDFSIWQHADGTKPLPEHGYALDDATRGLLVCLALGKTEQAHTLFDYILQSRSGFDFNGFYDADRQPIQFPASEDAKGQVIWAMGYAASVGFEKKKAVQLISLLAPGLLSMTAMRGQSYALLGAVYVDSGLALAMKRKLVERFNGLGNDWFWPEETLTYGNGIVAYALLRFGQIYNDDDVTKLGMKVLNFLEACYTQGGRVRSPIGNVGWFTKGQDKPAEQGQQAIDVTYMMLAWMCAYQISGDTHDRDNVHAWMQWFEGKNIAHERMYDPETLKAFDGIHQANPDHHSASGVNTHSGAESNICFLLSKYIDEQSTIV